MVDAMQREHGLKLRWAWLALLLSAPAFAGRGWSRVCGGQLRVVGQHARLTARRDFRLIYTDDKTKPRRLEAVKVEDPHAQVDMAHPFEVALNDERARERLTYVEESLRRRKVVKKVYITDREVLIVASDENPDQFSENDFKAHTPVILIFTKPVDENINGTLHGVISELFLGELDHSHPRYRETTQKTIDEIVSRVRALPAFRDRDIETLRRHCKRIIFMRMVWLAKQEFYERHPDIRPAYAARWSADRHDRIKYEQQIEFYAHAAHDPIDADLSRAVIFWDAPGMELPFFSPPPLP